MTIGSRKRFAGFLAIAGLLIGSGSPASAHEASLAEIRIDTQAATLDVELDLLDLDYLLNLRKPGNSQIFAADVRESNTRIHQYVRQNLLVENCDITPRADTVGIRESLKPAVVAGFDLACPDDLSALAVKSRLLNDIPDYKSALTINDGVGSRLYLLADNVVQIPVTEQAAHNGFTRFTDEGFRHILAGFDHLLFLLLLALPIARMTSFASQLKAVAGVVTAFTVAHSITLTLSSLGYLSLPSTIVEPIIAASIVVTALLNLFGRPGMAIWPVAYLFGLIHGFGFAGAFAELTSGNAMHWTSILGFNIGVEIGQLIVTMIFLSALYGISRLGQATPLLLNTGSAAVGIIGAAWFVERVI